MTITGCGRDTLIVQNAERLFVGGFGQHLDLRQRPAADRMLDHHERILGKPHHAGDILRGDLERFGAEHHGAFTQLLETDSVMQTARGTAASIAKAGDQKIHLVGGGGKCFGGRRRTCIML